MLCATRRSVLPTARRSFVPALAGGRAGCRRAAIHARGEWGAQARAHTHGHALTGERGERFVGARCRRHRLELGCAHVGEVEHTTSTSQSAASAAAAASIYWHRVARVHGETRAHAYAGTMHGNRSQLPAAGAG
jgi:hypothetical protein